MCRFLLKIIKRPYSLWIVILILYHTPHPPYKPTNGWWGGLKGLSLYISIEIKYRRYIKVVIKEERVKDEEKNY